jgi:ATP-binding cassette subfamily B protein
MEKEADKSKSHIKISDIIRAFWVGAKHFKGSMIAGLGTYILANIFELMAPLYYKRFFDVVSTSLVRETATQLLLSIIVSVLIINAMRWVCYRIGSVMINYFESHVMAKLRQQAFDYTIGHSYTFFANTFTGSLTQKIGRFARAFERLYDTLVYSLIPLLVYTVGVIIVVWHQEPQLAWAIIVWAIIIGTFSISYSRWKLKYDLASSAADTKAAAQLADSLTNHNTISSFSASDFETGAYEGVTNDQARATLKTWNLGELMSATQGALSVIIEFVVFYFAIKYWSIGRIGVGTFVLVQVYIIGLSQRLWGLSNIVRNIYESLGDSREMVDILQTTHEVADVKDAKDLVVSEGVIEIKDASFEFNSSRQVLKNINLKINSGEKVALIGPSGAGKSTVVRLLTRMYNLEKGEILIDGQDIQKVKQESLRHNISLVPQDPILFHRSLMENIRYGKRDATNEEVIEAARLAHCDEFIESLPQKYETLVGERGIKLSGGERQRVAIARAILKNAPILILDEATSSLDSHSESLIQDALDKLMKGKTTIVIAHRLSTIRKMDRIIVLRHGEIIEEGEHEALLKRDESLYRTLWELQAGGFITE